MTHALTNIDVVNPGRAGATSRDQEGSSAMRRIVVSSGVGIVVVVCGIALAATRRQADLALSITPGIERAIEAGRC